MSGPFYESRSHFIILLHDSNVRVHIAHIDLPVIVGTVVSY